VVLNKHSKTINFLNYIQILAPYRVVNTLRIIYKNTQLMPNEDIIIVCSEFEPKHINTAVWAGRRILMFAIPKCLTHIYI